MQTREINIMLLVILVITYPGAWLRRAGNATRANAPAFRAPLALRLAPAAGRVKVPHCDRAVLATAEETRRLGREARGGARGRRWHARHDRPRARPSTTHG
eukprot:scaffold13073_cov54-Phaeocystis_antarctica.AAC.1